MQSEALLQPGEAFFEEAFAPLGHDLEGQIEAAGDGLVLNAGRGHKHDLGSDDFPIRRLYRLLLASSSLRSAGESSMTNGDLLGTCSSLWWIRNKVTYFIIVFMTGSTKSSTRCRRVPAADGWDPATEGNPNRSPLKRQLAHSGLASDHHPRIASAAGGATCLTALRKRITVRDGSRVVRAAAPADNRAAQSRHLDMDKRVPLVCERCLDGSRSSALPSRHSRRVRRSLSPALPPHRLRIRHP